MLRVDVESLPDGWEPVGEAVSEGPLEVRVGLYTGTAVVAHGGGEAKDVFGDTPNIAARIQAVAEADSVFITAATHRLVAGRFVVEERGTPATADCRNLMRALAPLPSSGCVDHGPRSARAPDRRPG